MYTQHLYAKLNKNVVFQSFSIKPNAIYMDNQIQLFQGQQVRYIWDEEKEQYFFSVVDVISVLTVSADAAAYWRKLKQRLKAEGNETVTSCHTLKMSASDELPLNEVEDTL